MKTTIIIGGGAAGLMAAYELSKHKNHVIILEAKNRLGGRIFTTTDNNFSEPIEAGAEFIHGNLPLTISLLKEAGLNYHAIAGKMFQLEAGKFHQQKNKDAHWGKVMKQMQQLEVDMTLDDFLNTFFKDDKYVELRESVKNFAGGFDLADAAKASVKSLAREWNEEMEKQYRIDGGYMQLINYLETECRKNGCIINTNCCVKKINWQKDEVNINTMCSRFFKGNKIIITVPVSVLQAKDDNENYIEFAPSIPQHIKAAKNIGFGTVIKILLEFSEAFWKQQSNNVGFIFTSQKIPTWWTQLPSDNAILTGWVGGEKAVALRDKTNEEILDIALQSLSNAFAINKDDLQLKLKASSVYNWYKEPDINGGYSYNTLESVAAKKILRQPVDDIIFFCGEALFEGTPVATVEAALDSGRKTASTVLATLN
jgi:monoamine oxidase